MQDAPPHAEPAARPERPPPPILSGSGILLGSACFAASLTPSLIPRDAVMQGVVGGAVFAIGYGAAVTVLILWRWLELYEPPRRHSLPWAVVAALAGVGLGAVSLSRVAERQDAIRALMGMAPVEETHPLSVLAIAAATAAALMVLFWLIRWLILFLSRRLHPVIPPRLALVIGMAATAAIVFVLVDGVLVRKVFEGLDQAYATLDELMEPDTLKPRENWRTGSEASLIPWTTLGRDGRRFIDRQPMAATIAEYWGGAAKQPLRIYAGLGSADTPVERAQLALDEMLRVGAFDRDVLVVALPTGTGFMDEGAIEPLEYLYKGDLATVAVQYSYLQSPFSLIFEPEAGTETGRALLRTVYQYWTDLPDDARPRLYLYGLSLGAYSSERSVRLHEVIGDPFDGALWTGPPFVSPIHSDITANRVPGTPAWLPSFEEGELVRTMNQTELTDAGAPWGPLRIVYFQHASDPIVFFDYSLFWRRPDWLNAPRGPDVVDTMRWYPVITALQVAADMAVSTHVPRGYGHEYAASRYVDAWVALTDPDLADEEIARLKARFATETGADDE